MTDSDAMTRTGSTTPRTVCWLLFAAVVATELAGCAREPARDVSVVLVSPDSLRADRLRPWNPEAAAATPRLERLAARGTVYLNAWSASPWTAPSMVSVMTGLYPPSHGVVYRDDTTSAALPTLPRIAAAEGYEIGNFSFFSQISYFRNLGLGPAEKGLSHARVAGSFRQWLDGLEPGAKFFAWVHLLETHLPYGASGYLATEVAVPGSSGLEEAQLNAVVPAGSAEFAPGDRGRLLALYDHDVEEMDHVLGQVLDALKETEQLADTLVIFVADHGEELLDHGWIGHASTSIHAKLVPEILRIPLLLAGPGVPAGEARHELVQQVDVLRTVAGLLGLDPPAVDDGRPLPGILGGWRSWGSWGGRRHFAFFDSSPGGNLTPQDQRGERLQGVTDGGCLLFSHVYPDAPEDIGSMDLGGGAACGEKTARRLLDALEDWRQDQTRQRLALLARYPDGAAPASAEIDGYAPAIEVLQPLPGDRLSFAAGGGQVAFEWRGEGETFWIEYLLGRAPRQIRGSFQVAQKRVVFGPVPEGFWNDVASYSPSRIRIADPANRERSSWVAFEVLPVQ